MRNIVTIGWWNWHAHLLATLKNSDYFKELEISALVSMSDDGRTTGKLMKQFESKFKKHLPPPGDLRRCLYALWDSKHAILFQNILESRLDLPWNISEYSLRELFLWTEERLEFITYLESKNPYFLDFTLEIDEQIAWHKLWNILMACLYRHFLYDYNYMLRFMHDLLDVSASVVAITTDKAYIEAELENWDIIEKQDAISNVADYNARIKFLKLMKDSDWAKHNFKIDTAILNAEYIVIAPGDLYTSTISNLLIGWINSLLRKSNAKIVYICNTTNKWGETGDYSVKDFTEKLEAYLWKKIDILVVNNKKEALSNLEQERFKNDISVKWGSYIYVSEEEKQYFIWKGMQIIQTDLLSKTSFYRHDSAKLWEVLKEILI